MHCDRGLEDHYIGAPGCNWIISSRAPVQMPDGQEVEALQITSKKEYDYAGTVEFGRNTWSAQGMLIPATDLIICATDGVLNVAMPDTEVGTVDQGAEVLNALQTWASLVNGEVTEWQPVFFDACTGMYHLEDAAGALVRKCDTPS